MTWEVGLGMVFISGVIFLLLTIFGLREVIVTLIPKNLKYAIGVAVGFYIAQLGFQNGGLMVVDSSIALGDVTSPEVLLTIIGLVIVVGLTARKIKGAMLIGIIMTTIIGIPMGITSMPERLVSMPPSIEPIAFKLDIMGALKWSLFPLIFTFFVGDFFSTLGTLLGVSAKADLLDEEGGRTGLTAVATAVCFGLTIFLTPLAAIIPSEATAPALILIGLLMINGIKNIDLDEFTEAFPSFAMILFTIFASSISTGISMGIITYVVTKIVSGRYKELNWGIILLCIPLVAYFLV